MGKKVEAGWRSVSMEKVSERKDRMKKVEKGHGRLGKRRYGEDKEKEG